LVDALYQLDCEAILCEQVSLATTQKGNDIDAWHFRLGQAREQCIKNMAYKELATGIRLPKQAKLSFCKDVLPER